ncbi:putative membrane protein [Phycicoccus badiiscoriae]|uniref:Putative membrane protein n=1 Tax=Pedococcus badiiscoriae TaxID=642776 RepID=A0A852WK30_9MICO|nr:DUF1003 domain-containing protein [Pedococcus badiiscoriae]NYG07971.1 putative membrane protein [Pedococcus badiiscoriae]
MTISRTSVAAKHPAIVKEAEARAASIQNRAADAITAFAGSMWFVYAHIALFAVWMAFVEPNPWPTLTLVVSLEAIFLSTFVMIAQNRQAAFSQAKADHDFINQELELKTNTELTRQIQKLTLELHQAICAAPLSPRPTDGQASSIRLPVTEPASPEGDS